MTIAVDGLLTNLISNYSTLWNKPNKFLFCPIGVGCLPFLYKISPIYCAMIVRFLCLFTSTVPRLELLSWSY